MGWDPGKAGEVGKIVGKNLEAGWLLEVLGGGVAVDLAVQVLTALPLTALALAMERDGSSGGVVRLAAITERGVERQVLQGDKLPRFSSA